MEIEFDPVKDAANVAKHGLSLAEAAEFDLTTAVVLADDRFDYRETRYRAFGLVEGEAHCLVFAVRATTIRAISYRRAHRKEIRRHGL